MKKYMEILIILFSLFLLIYAGLSSYYYDDFGFGILTYLPFVFPFLVSLYYSIKDIESEKLNRILWKMPLLSSICFIFLSIFMELCFMGGAKVGNCREFDCLAGLVFPILMVWGFFINLLVTFVISLIIYFIKKK